MTNKAACMLGFSLGCATGAAMGLICAPRPGRETRERIRGIAQNSRGKLHTAREYGSGVAERFRGASHWVKLRASAVAEKAHNLASSRRHHSPELASVSGDNDKSPPRFID